jgi:hypothetical protein
VQINNGQDATGDDGHNSEGASEDEVVEAVEEGGDEYDLQVPGEEQVEEAGGNDDQR